MGDVMGHGTWDGELLVPSLGSYPHHHPKGYHRTSTGENKRTVRKMNEYPLVTVNPVLSM